MNAFEKTLCRNLLDALAHETEDSTTATIETVSGAQDALELFIGRGPTCCVAAFDDDRLVDMNSRIGRLEKTADLLHEALCALPPREQ